MLNAPATGDGKTGATPLLMPRISPLNPAGGEKTQRPPASGDGPGSNGTAATWVAQLPSWPGLRNAAYWLKTQTVFGFTGSAAIPL